MERLGLYEMNDRDKFYSVINQFDFLVPLWDQEHHKMKIDTFEKRLGTLSTGEQKLAKFMAAVWSHENQYEFDLFNSMTLSTKFFNVIKDWVNNPYWP